MTLILLAYAVVAAIVFLVTWRGFEADLTAALVVAVLGTGALGGLLWSIANIGRLL